MNESRLPRSDQQKQWINSLVSITPEDAIIVEIGTYVGNFSLRFKNNKRKIFCIDVWDDIGAKVSNLEQSPNEIFKIFCENAGDELFKTVFPVRFPSLIAAQFFNLPITLLYIDGLHDYENTKQDILAWAPKVIPNGLICGDDYIGQFAGVKRAVDEIYPNVRIACGNQWMKIK